MKLTKDNYFSQEAGLHYMSASQVKSFLNCEAGALAEIKGEYQMEQSVSLMVGSYVDAHFEGSMKEFTENNPGIFTKNGLKAEYKNAENVIERINRDELFVKYLSGQKQVILTRDIDGIPFKCKIDSYHPEKAIVDLKVMKDFDGIWKDGLKLHFIEAWGYDTQGAIYQAVEGNNLPFFIAAATKEKPEPNIEIFSIGQERLDYCLDLVRANIKRFALIKTGEILPERCGKCNYCRATKKLSAPLDYLALPI